MTIHPTPTPAWGLEALHQLREARRHNEDDEAAHRDGWIQSNGYFYDRLKRVLRSVIEPGARVLEVRCQTGHLLASVNPSYGVGIEVSRPMVEKARENHPELEFLQGDPEDLAIGEQFDYVLFSHVFDTVDILEAFRQARKHCSNTGRAVVINYNHLWQPVLELASRLGLRSRFVEPNWLSEHDVAGFLHLAGFRPVHVYRLLLFPKRIPLLSELANNLLARLPGLRRLCLMQVIVARPSPEPVSRCGNPSVSVIIPCRNERGNVEPAVERMPVMGSHTEILFCDDKSTDGTADEVRRMQRLYPEKDIRLIPGPAICKAENVWTGFRAARGDILMILDADLAVMPEELPIFFHALTSRLGDFINGSRLVYPVPHNAMKFANMIGNKIFGIIFSFLLDRRIKDTLCGTKVLWRRDWERLERGLGQCGLRDLWGDYELLFGASRLNLEIVEVPVHYQERVYGATKMTRVVSNGVRMVRICWHASRHLPA